MRQQLNDLDRRRREADDEDGKGEDGDAQAGAIERDVLVGRLRVTGPKKNSIAMTSAVHTSQLDEKYVSTSAQPIAP